MVLSVASIDRRVTPVGGNIYRSDVLFRIDSQIIPESWISAKGNENKLYLFGINTLRGVKCRFSVFPR